MATIDENVASILTFVDDLEGLTRVTNSNTAMTNTKLEDIKGKLDTANSILTEIRGATPDIREAVTDIKIVPIYVGDRDERRAQSEKTLKELIDEGYRPYMDMGISEDYSRQAFAKYTGVNAAK